MNPNHMLTSGFTDLWEVAPGVIGLRTLFVNVAYISSSPSDWILVDAGLGMFAGSILNTAKEHFGKPPLAIILTHGHFDHVGTIKELIEEWKVPVYAHPLELPYLTGQRDYPPADPSVGGGLMAVISPLYPHRSIDLGTSVLPLPEDGNVPGALGWKWIHTPGHSPGHISLFREQDRVLIAGDAFITVKQESALAVVMQQQEIHGPPTYFTIDWAKAEDSVRKLAHLNPLVALTGHGLPMRGTELSAQLALLSKNFKKMAVPDQGKYVESSDV
ncbi:MBL fold metallo-hydrolase [Paenibacillus wynnii]|uniref:Metallo-beta-lactamase family protein n=1 Tax=Paenibacillus wynnii TaxID=268407 RepID=A0A098M4F2_9BACL|nr:MBL fold metallo-hydrolase [Paenibacillus wynnii]KGE16432.1 metallo-beta-lactamase family protein [Paenibacillus wynnii]